MQFAAVAVNVAPFVSEIAALAGYVALDEEHTQREQHEQANR